MTALQAEQADSPFHAGERQVQEWLGVREIENWARKAVRPYMPDQHRDFYNGLPFLVVAARDGRGRPWVTLLDGADGFVTSPDARHLVINAMPAPGDALEGAIAEGTNLGILGIELATRRRNRVNGRVAANTNGALTLRVDQTFGNCPQYIREREWRRADGVPSRLTARGTVLTSSQRHWIGSADTFFIATGYRGSGEHAGFGMDASHRGGDPGFVEVLDSSRLRFPDYAGNNHFNTLGNLVLDPGAGLLFVNFRTGSLLQLTGTASIDWEPEEILRFPGARRLVTFEVGEVIEIEAGVGLRWDDDAGSVRLLLLTDKIVDSDEVTSFIFEARDGGPLPGFEPGQHLPVEIAIPGAGEPVRRTYSLSGSPKDGHYRISVKRQPGGLVSRYLHDTIEPGQIIRSGRPAGTFTLPCAACPLVLVSAGVGVTPMLSMLHATAAEAGSRPVLFVHGVRDGLDHPFAGEVRQIAAGRANIRTHFAYSKPRREDRIGRDFDGEGRIDVALLDRIGAGPDAHYFLCGPAGFMADIQTGLEQRHVPADRIHTESFGPAG